MVRKELAIRISNLGKNFSQNHKHPVKPKPNLHSFLDGRSWAALKTRISNKNRQPPPNQPS